MRLGREGEGLHGSQPREIQRRWNATAGLVRASQFFGIGCASADVEVSPVNRRQQGVAAVGEHEARQEDLSEVADDWGVA